MCDRGLWSVSYHLRTIIALNVIRLYGITTLIRMPASLDNLRSAHQISYVQMRVLKQLTDNVLPVTKCP
jgi:hypothetical protein